MQKNRSVALLIAIMRMSALQIMLLGLFAGFAYAKKTKAQEVLNKTISLSVRQTEVKRVILLLQEQTGVKFIFSSQLIGAERKISCNANGVKLGAFLDAAFKPLNIAYAVDEDKVLLFFKNNAGLAAPSADQETGSIKGNVKNDKGGVLTGVSVELQGARYGTTTNTEGNYTLQNIPAGNYTLTFTYIGYLIKSESITVKGAITVNAVLSEDALKLQDVVVTGTGNPKKKIESSVAITTVSNKDMINRAPLNSTDLLKAIPGLTVENTGGDGPGNVWVRGFPQQGGYIFLGIMEDGLPLLPTGFNSLPSVDQYYKTDLTLKTIEGVRGGNAAIILPSTPGAVVNNISYTGTDKAYGQVKYTQGWTQNMERVDANTGGKINGHIKYNIGGFYRTDKGVIPPGYTANKGGQLKGNITYAFNNNKGFIRVYGKYLNDITQFLLPAYYAYDGSGKPRPVYNGFDLFTQSMVTTDRKWNYTDRNGQVHTYDLADGMHTRLWSGQLQLSYNLGSGWQLNNNFRYQKTKFSTTAQTASGIAALDGKLTYRYLDGSAYAGRDSIVSTIFLTDKRREEQFVDFIDVKKKAGAHQLTIGGGFYQYNVHTDTNYTYFGVQEFTAHPRRLLRYNQNGNPVDELSNGLTQVSAATVIGNTRILSAYLSDEIALSDKWRVDLGVRFDNQQVKGRRPFYGLDADGIPNSGGIEMTGATPYSKTVNNWAASAGVNYKISNTTAMFARATRAYNAPTIADYNLAAFADSTIKKRPVYLGEIGMKYARNSWSLFVSASYSAIKNVSLNIAVPTVTAGTQTLLAFGSTRTWSGEFEVSYKPVNPLTFRLTGTIQDSRYTGYKASTRTNTILLGIMGDTTYSFTGNRTERVPVVATELSASYEYKGLSVYMAGNYASGRYSSPSDSYRLASYIEMKAGIGYTFFKHLSIRSWVNNLLNTRALTEGDVRGDQFRNFTNIPRGTLMIGRDILPRTFWSSVAWIF